MKMNSLFFAPLLAAACVCAQAQTVAPAAAAGSAPEPTLLSSITGNINVTTNYKFRGQDQGTGRYFSPAVQGGFDWSQNGFYVGNWNSNVSFAGNIEMDFYSGYKGEIAKDFGYDVGILQYYYPQRKGSPINFDVTELYGALTYMWASAKYSHTVSSDYFGIGESFQKGVPLGSRPKGRNTGYLDLSANYPLVEKLTLNGHLGYTRYASGLRNVRAASGATIGTPDFYDYKLGLTYDLGSGLAVAGAVVGANKKDYYGDINKTRVILTLSKTL
ncbi:MAG: TorF family putative porin [Pseudomonadota bacterium]|nr:TorF family putative porin [Pseudomonadota bacterium]